MKKSKMEGEFEERPMKIDVLGTKYTIKRRK